MGMSPGGQGWSQWLGWKDRTGSFKATETTSAALSLSLERLALLPAEGMQLLGVCRTRSQAPKKLAALVRCRLVSAQTVVPPSDLTAWQLLPGLPAYNPLLSGR